jgi:eukaryotic-like serine/threonine-protein kinase
VAVFQQALVREPRYALALAGLGETYWWKYEVVDHDPKLVKQAADACTQAIAVADQAADAHLCMGIVDRGTGKYEQAVQQFQQAIRIDPTDDRPYKELGRVYGKLNRLTEAEETFKQAIRIRPSYWGAYNQLGVFYYNQGRIQDAIDTFKKVTQLAPDNFAALSNLAGMYLAAGQYNAAIEAAQKSITIRPSAQAAANLGIAYFYQHRYDDAVASDKRAAALDGNSSDLWLNLAEAYRWRGNAKAETIEAATKAEQLASAALKINADDPNALATRAYAGALRGRSDNVQRDIKHAIAVAPKIHDVLFEAALADLEAGNAANALVYARAAAGAGLPLSWLKDHPAFDGVKNDPAWTQVFRPAAASH